MSDPILSGAGELRTDIEREFAELRERFYPGSRQVRRAVADAEAPPEPEQPKDDNPRWDRAPQTHYINSRPVEMFTIGALAEALHRRPVTLRTWETKGYLPKATFRTRGDKSRRLYTRAQVEGLVAIALEEGLIDPIKGKRIESTRFTERARHLFARLKAPR